MRTSLRQSPFSQSIRFEQLEPRQLRSGNDPSGGDLQLLLNADGSVVTQVTPELNQQVTLNGFKWYDGTPNGGITTLSNHITAGRVDGYSMWPNVPGLGSFPGPNASESGVRALAREVAATGNNLIVLDNETWHFDIRFYSRAVVNKTITDMQQVISWIRDERPQMKVGIYGYMSQSDDYSSSVWQYGSDVAAAGDTWYQGNLQHFAEHFADWQATSEYLRPLAQSVDYIFPVLYTGTSNMDAWERSARSTIEDSRRYGKPVIPFLWPKYHEAAGPELGLTDIPTADWQRELDVVQNYADGAIIWNSSPVVGTEPWLTALLSTIDPQVGGQSYVAPPASAGVLTPQVDRVRSLFADLPIDGEHEDGVFLHG